MTAPATLPLGADSEISARKNDLAGFQHPAARLGWLLAHVKPPFTIGIGGEWGTGKSSLIHMALESLPADKIQVRRLDAWLFRHESNLGLPLIGALLAALAGEESRGIELKKRMYQALLIQGGFSSRWGEISVSDLEKLIDRIDRDMSANAELLAEPERFREDFDELVALALKLKGGERLVVVIENLDHCLPEGVLDFLERFQHFFKSGKCVLLAPVNEAALRAALAERLGAEGEAEAAAYVDRMLDAVFPCPVPRPAEAARYLLGRLKELVGQAEGAQGLRPERWDSLAPFFLAPANANLRRLNAAARQLSTLFLLYAPMIEEGPEYFLLHYLRQYHPRARRALELHGPALASALASATAEACQIMGQPFSEEKAASLAGRFGAEAASLAGDRGLVLLLANLALNAQRAQKTLSELLTDRAAKLERALSLA